jgi:hypothetical protein
MLSGARDGDVQHATTFPVGLRVGRPHEWRGMLGTIKNDAIKFLSFAFVHVHDMDPMQIVIT